MRKLTLIIVLVAGVAAGAEENGPACAVSLLAPKRGDRVGREGKTNGIAKIPSGTYLWVLTHRKDFAAEWWPQMGRPAVIQQDGSWVIITRYGTSEDIKEDFEVAVVVVDANTNTQLRDWFKTAKERDYPPIEFPTTVDACPVTKTTVSKTSH